MPATMYDSPPPSSISYSLDDLEEIDDASDLTGPCGDDVLPRGKEFNVELTADLCYHLYALNRERPSQRAEIRREVLELRQQVAEQRDELDALSSKLSRCEAENKVLKAEKAVLVDKLAVPTKEQHDARRGWFAKAGGKGGGSLQMLVDTNAKLMTDNARLQVLLDVMQKSFQSYIKATQRNSENDQRAIEALAQENELLRRRLAAPELRLSQTSKPSLEPVAGYKPKSSLGFAGHRFKGLSASDLTAATSLESSLTDTYPEVLPLGSSDHSGPVSMIRNSLQSIPEQELELAISGADWIAGGKDIKDFPGEEWIAEREDADLTEKNLARNRGRRASAPVVGAAEIKGKFAEGDARGKSDELLVDFGETPRPRHSTQARLGRSLTEEPRSLLHNEAGACQRSEELLVDFGEGRRPQTRKWASFRL